MRNPKRSSRNVRKQRATREQRAEMMQRRCQQWTDTTYCVTSWSLHKLLSVSNLRKNNEMRALKHGQNDQLESQSCTANCRRTRQSPQNRRAKTHTSVNEEIQFSASVCACVRSKDSDGRVAQLCTRLVLVTHKSPDGRRYCPPPSAALGLRYEGRGNGLKGQNKVWRHFRFSSTVCYRHWRRSNAHCSLHMFCHMSISDALSWTWCV